MPSWPFPPQSLGAGALRLLRGPAAMRRRLRVSLGDLLDLIAGPQVLHHGVNDGVPEMGVVGNPDAPECSVPLQLIGRTPRHQMILLEARPANHGLQNEVL